MNADILFHEVISKEKYDLLDDFWKTGENWTSFMASDDWLASMDGWKKADGKQPVFEMRDGIADALPATSSAFQRFADFTQKVDEKNLYTTDPWAVIYSSLHKDLTGENGLASYTGPAAEQLAVAAAAAATFETVNYKEAFEKIDKDWHVGIDGIWTQRGPADVKIGG